MSEQTFLPHDWYPRPLPSNATLGAGTWLHSSFAFLHNHSEQSDAVVVGENTGLYINTQFNLGPRGRVHIGSFCTIVGLIVSTNGSVWIGDYTFIAHEVVIADGPCALPSWRKATEPPEISIGPNAWIGARCVILPGARVGEGAIVGASSVLSSEVPDYAIVAGDPLRVVGDAREQGAR